MSVTLKLIGNASTDYIIKFPSNTFTLQEIYEIMREKNLYVDCCSTLVKFIINGETISDINKIYHISDNVNIYLFTQDKNTRDALSNKFLDKSVNVNDMVIMKPIADEMDIVMKENYNTVNLEIIEQFKDPDFKKLFEICITKPHLLGIVNNYISNGNISTDIMICETDDFNYMETYTQIIELGFNLNDMVLLKSIINHFEGSINLTIRYILFKNLLPNCIQ